MGLLTLAQSFLVCARTLNRVTIKVSFLHSPLLFCAWVFPPNLLQSHPAVTHKSSRVLQRPRLHRQTVDRMSNFISKNYNPLRSELQRQSRVCLLILEGGGGGALNVR